MASDQRRMKSKFGNFIPPMNIRRNEHIFITNRYTIDIRRRHTNVLNIKQSIQIHSIGTSRQAGRILDDGKQSKDLTFA